MSEIARRVWTEPAVALGLLASLALLVLALLTGADWDASVIAGIAAPFVTALGIRPLVTPNVKVDEALEVATAPSVALKPPDLDAPA